MERAVNYLGLLIRDLESFGPKTWGARGTLKVLLAARKLFRGTEINSARGSLTQTLWIPAINAKTPRA
jgi:hypothetical protein